MEQVGASSESTMQAAEDAGEPVRFQGVDGPAVRPYAVCIRCEYDLRGLPERNACPECGLAYDEDSAMFPAVVQSNQADAYARFLPFVFAGIMLSFHLVRGGPFGFPGIFLITLLSSLGIILIYRGATGKPLVRADKNVIAILPDGIHLRLEDVQRRFIGWQEVKSIDIRGRSKHKFVECRLYKKRRDSLPLPPLRLTNPPAGKDAQQLFVRLADSQRQRFQATSQGNVTSRQKQS